VVRVRADVLVGLTVWRLMVAAIAWYGFDQVTGYSQVPPWESPWGWDALAELSQQASLLAVVCYLGFALYPLFVGGRRHEPRGSWLRGSLVITLWLVSVTANFVLDNGGQLDVPGFLFEHLITPIIVTADFLIVGRGQDNLRWWFPLTWATPALAYFVALAFTGFRLYGIFNPGDPGQITLIASAFLAAILGAGYLFYGVCRVRAHVLGHTGPSAPLPVLQATTPVTTT
jgi:hypothetical protein